MILHGRSQNVMHLCLSSCFVLACVCCVTLSLYLIFSFVLFFVCRIQSVCLHLFYFLLFVLSLATWRDAYFNYTRLSNEVPWNMPHIIHIFVYTLICPLSTFFKIVLSNICQFFQLRDQSKFMV